VISRTNCYYFLLFFYYYNIKYIREGEEGWKGRKSRLVKTIFLGKGKKRGKDRPIKGLPSTFHPSP
jgi:hypothetical protein